MDLRSGDTRPTTEPSPQDRDRSKTTDARERDMGAALRKVYQRAVDEAVPDEMLALLGKLD